MTNLIATILGLFVIAAITVDILVFGTENLIFLSKKLLELIEWIAFWR